MNDKLDCFARVNKERCHALVEKNCENCKFYKHRDKIKRNPFYGFSYKNKKDLKHDMTIHKIRSEQVL